MRTVLDEMRTRRWRAFLVALIGLGEMTATSAYAQGYRIVGKRFEIRTAEEWKAWTFPQGAVEILPAGTVKPAFFRKNVNAVSDAQSFVYPVPSVFYPEFTELSGKSPKELGAYAHVSGGIKDAGSNLGDAVNVMDGDLHTYWQPDPNDVLSRWWVEMDLGRLVSATRIVLRFVEEGEGDPFLRFNVYVSKGDLPYFGAEHMGWRQVYRSVGRNYDQRLFEIELDPELPGDMEGEGALVQYVRVAVLETRGERAQVVSKEEYELLPQQFRGPLVYYRKTPFGEEGEREISWEGYERLPEEERGRIQYYRCELPRLAEVEVWTLGDDVALGILNRGGSVRNSVTGQIIGDSEVDGAYTSYRKLGGTISRWSGVGSTSLLVDLGCSFWVDMTRLISMLNVPGREDEDPHITSYEIEGSDGTCLSGGELVWRTLTLDGRMDLDATSIVRTEDRFDLRKIRFLNLRFPTVFTGRATEFYDAKGNRIRSVEHQRLYLSEFQVYGEGYVPEVTLFSPFIEAGWTKALGQIRWEGETSPGTTFEIQTRSGSEIKPVKRFFDMEGWEITLREWYKLPFFRQGPVTTELRPTRWSVWSKPYKKPGEWVRSPTPSPYFQIQVRLLSDDPYLAPSIRSLSVDYFDPLVQEVLGEIVPCEVSQAGRAHTYSCFLRCRYDARNLGFDGILLRCAHPVDVELLSVRRGTEEEFAEGSASELSLEDYRVVPTGSDSIWIAFPEVVKPVARKVFEIRFSAEVYLKGTAFEVFLVNTDRGELYQWVRSGDAVGFAESEEMRVMVPVEGRVIADVEIGPDPFTPNGDGINDEVEIGFSVFNVDVARTVRVEIRDLGGRVMWRLEDVRENVSGRHRVMWDGRDGSGQWVVPGIYVVRICLDADSRLVAEDRVVVRTVCVVY